MPVIRRRLHAPHGRARDPQPPARALNNFHVIEPKADVDVDELWRTLGSDAVLRARCTGSAASTERDSGRATLEIDAWVSVAHRVTTRPPRRAGVRSGRPGRAVQGASPGRLAFVLRRVPSLEREARPRAAPPANQSRHRSRQNPLLALRHPLAHALRLCADHPNVLARVLKPLGKVPDLLRNLAQVEIAGRELSRDPDAQHPPSARALDGGATRDSDGDGARKCSERTLRDGGTPVA